MFEKVILYARFSDPTQKKGLSLERQFGDMRAEIAADGALATLPVEQWADEGKSGYHGHHRLRGDLGRFERECLAGEHSGTLFFCECFDRLSREGHDATRDLVNTLIRNGVSIRTLDGDYYEAGKPLTLEQVMKQALKAELARMESENKAKRTASNWKAKREIAQATGKAVTKLVKPWIVVSEDRRMSLDEARGSLVLRWFELAHSGLGTKTIADTLDREGVPTWPRFDGRTPKRWNRTFISRVLRDRAVIGEFTPTVNGVPQEPWPNYFPACVPADLFAAVNNAAPIRKAASTGLRSEKVVNLVSGLITCGACGTRLQYRKGRAEGARWTNPQGKTYSHKRDCGSLVCPLGEANKCSNRRYLAYLTFEDALLDACLHLALDDNSFANRGEVARLGVTIAERTRAHELASVKFTNLATAWAEKPSALRRDMADAAEAEVERLAANLEALRAQREQARGRADSAAHLARVADIRGSLYHHDLGQRVPIRKKVKQALTALIERITFDGENVTVTFVAGAAVLRFDRKGHLLHALDFVKDGRAVGPVLADYARRRRDAKERGILFNVTAAPAARG
jgi:DNA invertase Pin-like site-specific DNA recombinase